MQLRRRRKTIFNHYTIEYQSGLIYFELASLIVFLLFFFSFFPVIMCYSPLHYPNILVAFSVLAFSTLFLKLISLTENPHPLSGSDADIFALTQSAKSFLNSAHKYPFHFCVCVCVCVCVCFFVHFILTLKRAISSIEIPPSNTLVPMIAYSLFIRSINFARRFTCTSKFLPEA